MSNESRSGHPGGRVPGLVAAALVAHDLPGSTTDERLCAARYVDEMVDSMPDVMRFGVHVAGAAAYVALCGMARGRFERLDPVRRADLAARLGGRSLPVISEFGRLTRGLGLASVYETRHGQPGGGGA